MNPMLKNMLMGIAIVVVAVVGWYVFFSGGNSGSGTSPMPPSTTSSDRDCSDFTTHAQAQAFFESEGGPATDFHGLDRDKDGLACETLP